MTDFVGQIGKSIVQHGPLNDRVYLLKLSGEDYPGIVRTLLRLAEEKGYSKILVKIPEEFKPAFEEAGFVTEAVIPGLHRGKDDGLFLSRFMSDWRASEEEETITQLLARVLNRQISERVPDQPTTVFHEAGPEDAERIAGLYADTFSTYPFPIQDPAYIRQNMQKGVRYFYIPAGEGIAACSSAEVDFDSRSAEMTDFATGIAFRGMGYATILLKAMERAMQEAGILTVYTICRAGLYPINAVFRKEGYHHGGMLVKNTQICGHFESMHVWFRHLVPGTTPGREDMIVPADRLSSPVSIHRDTGNTGIQSG